MANSYTIIDWLIGCHLRKKSKNFFASLVNKQNNYLLDEVLLNKKFSCKGSKGQLDELNISSVWKQTNRCIAHTCTNISNSNLFKIIQDTTWAQKFLCTANFLHKFLCQKNEWKSFKSTEVILKELSMQLKWEVTRRPPKTIIEQAFCFQRSSKCSRKQACISEFYHYAWDWTDDILLNA